MESRGIGDDTLVVSVDHAGGHMATRLWWALRAYGHERVAILDGGYAAWKAAGKPLSTDAVTPDRATFTPRFRPELVSSIEGVLLATEHGQTAIIDARGPASTSVRSSGDRAAVTSPARSTSQPSR